MNLEEKIKQLEEELANAKKQLEVSKNVKINTVEDAFNIVKPKFFVNYDSLIMNDIDIDFRLGQINISTEKRAKQIKALIQLHLVADAFNMYKERDGDQYFIDINLDVEKLYEMPTATIMPIFNRIEDAQTAKTNFGRLFKELYMLD
jgi:hypothetical protein